MIDVPMSTSIPVTLHSNMLSFRDSNKSFELDGDLSKTMTSYKFKITHSNPQDRKLIHEFGKEMKTNINQVGRKSNRDTSLSFESIAIMASRDFPKNFNRKSK